jgi:hypothetical protein
MANLTKTTKDHEEIRRWAEERGGKPAHVKSTGSGEDSGILRIDFPGYSGEGSLEPIDWDEWFDKFDERNLALLYQEETAGGERSNFNKIVSAETAEQAEEKSHGRKRGAGGGGGKKAAKKAAKVGSSRSAATKKTKTTKKPVRKAAKAVAKGGRKTASKKAATKAKKSPAKKATKKAASKKRR